MIPMIDSFSKAKYIAKWNVECDKGSDIKFKYVLIHIANLREVSPCDVDVSVLDYDIEVSYQET